MVASFRPGYSLNPPGSQLYAGFDQIVIAESRSGLGLDRWQMVHYAVRPLFNIMDSTPSSIGICELGV
jgi:hypothetical protein